ncbi:hypothetical protein [Leptolyngbya sp. FACHB-17]|uniref:hypothetical protein n=1 Tax=unclassified Leptolyngbya TaxID=2650499 RepID=UPI00168079A2|nr:hypothetical protein [Leptolyngbya sp. FACHB-17]MBD2080943.1 hypothetical protein [Leptolyngbya sp. FACHB-17]
MNQTSRDRLYRLLPAIYQIRDAAEGEPLKALLAVIEQEVFAIEEDIDALYDNWFIETCVEWAIPYMGDLLDVRTLYASSFPTNSLVQADQNDRPLDTRPYGQQERRAYVANTLAYRRRKGTTPVLEQLVRDVTGWRARVIEFSRLLATTQNLNHQRMNSATIDLRNSSAIAQIGTPFEQFAAYTTEVRRASQGGEYGIPNIGIFVWRLQSYPIQRGTARAVAERCFTFDPLGGSIPLFNQPQTATDVTQQAQEINLPAPLRSNLLARELKQRGQLRTHGKLLPLPRYFNDSSPVLQIFINGQPNPIPPEEILICEVDSQQVPNVDFEQDQDDVTVPTKVVAVDPERGLIAFLADAVPDQVEVNYLYGFSDDLGGGSYSRGANKADLLKSPQYSIENELELPWIDPLYCEVEQIASADDNPLETAIQTWNQTTAAWQGIRDRVHVPLAQISIPPVQVSQVRTSMLDILPRFKPGVVEGLEVLPGFCPTQVFVTPGLAIDYQGRCLRVWQLETIDLNQLASPDQSGTLVLVICYRAAPEGVNYQFALVPETAIADTGYSEGTLIAIARLTIPGENAHCSNQPDLSVRNDSFRSGIAQGLDIKVRPGTLEAVMTPGTAVNPQGNVFINTTPQLLDLAAYQGVLVHLVVRSMGSGWQLEYLLSETEIDSNRDTRIAKLEVPKVKVVVDQSFVSDLEINGLTVTSMGSSIAIAAGTIKDRGIKLEYAYRFDLSNYAAQKLVLFISSQKDQGLPIQPIDPPAKQDWQQLGIVPQEPDSDNSGILLIKDSLTYTGDLEIAIPQGKKLKMIAADGCRPHLAGHVWVQGTAPAIAPNPGMLILEGLLIEGQLTVLPGYLKRLQVIHSTIVPGQGGLQVPTPQADRSSDCCLFDLEDPLAPIASIMTVLAFAQDAWAATSKLDRNPERYLGQVTQLVTQQINRLVTEIWQTLFPQIAEVDLDWDAPSDEEPDPQDNSRLEINLYHSICGAITLTDTVPKLSIEDSIVDSCAEDTGKFAIAAPGTDTEIFTSTILGMTTVRSLEASNSLFTQKVAVQLHQTGCMRFSHVPVGSQTPPRYQCQPDKAFQEALDPIPDAITSLASHASALFVASAGGGVFRSLTHGDLWEKTQPLENSYVAALFADSSQLVLAGTTAGQLFRLVNNGNTWESLKLSGATATITVLRQQQWKFEGTLMGDGSQLEINQRIPMGKFQAGDFIKRENGETRKIVTVEASIEKTRLTLDTPITPLPAAVIAFHLETLIAATAGDGVFRGNATGENWSTMSSNLTNLDVRSLVVNSAGQIFAGTAGDGVFEWITDNTEDYPKEQWVPLNQGLKNYNISALVIDSSETILAGTAGGGVFRLSPQLELIREQWVPVHHGLSSFDITALLVCEVSATVESEQEVINGQNTFFINGQNTFFREEGLQPGEPFTLSGRSQLIQSIESNIALTLQAEFSPALPPGTPYKPYSLLIAATADGKLFRSVTRGDQWQPLSLDLEGLAITALAVDQNNGHLFAGTAAGGVYRSIDEGESWQSINTELLNVIEKLVLIEQLQPTFTSTRYGDPGYAQLNQNCAIEIRTGAEDGAEIGVFNNLKQPQRQANLQANLEEYLRFGLEAGIVYIT